MNTFETYQTYRQNDPPQGRLDSPAIELAVSFIEADPRFDGSDSMKMRLAACLAHAPLTAEQRNRLAAVLLRALRHGTDAVFEAYARLAPAVTTPIFEAAVTCYASFCDPRVAGRAAHVMAVLRGVRRRHDGAPARARPRRVLCASAD
jgi:hypothetical protein